MQRIQREAISEVSMTRSPSRFVGVLRLPRLRTTRFHGGGLPDDRSWREGVLSLKHRRSNETNQYHPAQQSPHENNWLPGNENVHRRPPGTKSDSHYRYYTAKNPRYLLVNIVLVVTGRGVLRQRFLSIVGMWLQSTRIGNRIHSKPGWRKPR